jgi:protein tyrosine/serine phosphatase
VNGIELEGVINFRDFGGYAGADGRRVRRGRLFRSGHHTVATDADLARLAELDLALIVDLRRHAERSRDPARRPAPCRAAVLEHAGPPDEGTAPHLAFLAEMGAGGEHVAERMIDGYRSYAVDPHYVALHRDYFARLAEAEGAVLVHCHAGKDRTGVLCALTLHVLGASREDVFADYLTSNAYMRPDARVRELARAFEKIHRKPMTEALLWEVIKVDAAYLEAFMAAVETGYGGLDPYLEAEIGVTPARRAKIRERFLG